MNSPVHSLSIAEFIDQKYWPVARLTLCDAWQARTVDYLALIKEGLGQYPINGLPPEVVEGWWNGLRTRYETPATPNKVLVRLKNIYRKAIQWKYATESPVAHLTKKKERERKFTFLTDEQIDNLLRRVRGGLKYYILFARYTGARRSSLAKLEERDVRIWSVIDIDEPGGRREVGEITFRKTKNGEDLVVPLHPKLIPVCKQLLTGEPERRLLPQYKDVATISRGFRRIARKHGLTNFRFHDFRHRVGSALGAKYQNTKLIMEVLGHKDPRMSARYTHLSADVLRQALTSAL